MAVHRWLFGLRKVDSDVVIIEPHIIPASVAPVTPIWIMIHVLNASVGTPLASHRHRGCRQRSARALSDLPTTDLHHFLTRGPT